MTDPSLVELKKRLRDLARARRDGLDLEDRVSKSAQIVLRIAGLIANQPHRYLAAYASIGSEADMLPLLDLMIEQGGVACLPAVVGDTLVFRTWTPGFPLVPSPFGSREPMPDAPEVTPDVIIVPVVAFDRTGGRLGYGRGFYDRALAALRASGAKPRVIGAAFAVQEVGAIPVEPHDVPLDAIATEDGVITPETA